MWELDHKEGCVLKNWCFWTVVLEKTLESCLDCKEIKPVNPKANQSWIFIGRTDAEVPILWLADIEPTHLKRLWCWERLKAGREGDNREGQQMVGWYHRLNGYEHEQALGDGEAWCAAVHGVTKSRAQLGYWTTTIKTVHSGQSV